MPGGSVFWADTPENFLRLIQAGYHAIKRIQPDSEVWLGGLGGRASYYSFYNRLLSLGAAPFFDVLSMHGRAPADEFRRIEQKHDIPPKPTVMSEWHAILQGNSQSTPLLSEDALSLRMMRGLLQQLKEGVTRTILFEMSNLVEKEALLFAGDNKWFVHSAGLFRRLPQPEPRHAAVVMATFLDASGRKAHFVKEFEPAPNVVAVHLATNRGPLLAIWNETGRIPASIPSTYATPDSRLIDWEGKPVPLATDATLDATLEPKRLYYLTAPDTERMAAAPSANHLVPPGTRTRTTRETPRGTSHDGPLFDSVKDSRALPPTAWITHDWTMTRLVSPPAPPVTDFRARAAAGPHKDGLDLVIEVDDATHAQHEPPSNAWNGDSVQIAIDCESLGLAGGHTELLAALTDQGPVLWKISAADTQGDIPARWSPSNGPVRHATTDITRDNGKTRYRIRLEWPELYPLAYDPSRPLDIAFVVNNNNGSGRIAYLEWGQGIARDKDPSLYGKLFPRSARATPDNPDRSR
jgi:hypothetical protein